MKKIQFSLCLNIVGVFFFLSLLSACNKNRDDITISGRVYDSAMGQYLSGATVKLSANGIQSGIYTPDFVELETATTDADGRFSFVRKKDRSDSFRITAIKNQYFSEVHEFSSSVFATSETYTKDLQLNPEGFIELRVFNAYPSDEDDKIIFYFSNSGLNCIDCCTNTPHTGTGPAFDTTFTCRFLGNKKIVFMRSVTKDQHTDIYFDSLFCPVFSTAQYSFPY